MSFEEEIPDILKKIHGLETNITVWLSPWEIDDYESYYEDQYEAISSNKNYYESFRNEIESATKLNDLELDDKNLEGVLKRQIYSSIIGALEAFLSETFINKTDENKDYLRNFIESFPDFKVTKISLSEILKEHEKIQITLRKVLLEIIYHNLPKVSKMYDSAFNIEFPSISGLARCVNFRHDLGHRNGRRKEGETIVIDKAMVSDLLKKSLEFVNDIAQKLKL